MKDPLWLFKAADEEHGPIKAEEALALLSRGKLSKDTPIRRSDSAHWTTVGNVTGLLQDIVRDNDRVAKGCVELRCKLACFRSSPLSGGGLHPNISTLQIIVLSHPAKEAVVQPIWCDQCQKQVVFKIHARGQGCGCSGYCSKTRSPGLFGLVRAVRCSVEFVTGKGDHSLFVWETPTGYIEFDRYRAGR